MSDDVIFVFDLKIAADALAALANRNRLNLIKLVAENEVDVGTLAKKVNVSQSAVSQHLSKLRKLKLVHTRRDRQTIYYSASDEAKRLVKAINSATDGSA